MDDAFREYLIDGHRIASRYALAPPPTAPIGLAGSELGNRPGASLEFMDHREYLPGDDLRRIDWSAFARSDKLTVKLYREEVCPHLDLVLDGSKSMDLEGSRKAQATVTLSAVLAAAAENAGYSHSVFLARDGCQKIPNSSAAPPLWQEIDFDHCGDTHQSFLRLGPTWRTRGIRVLVSDLLWLGDPMTLMPRIAQKASTVVVIQLLAASDVEPPRHGNVRLLDSESDQVQEVFVDAAAQKRYRDALSRHQQNWHRACKQVGAVMTTLVAEDLLKHWNLETLVAMELLRVS